MVFASANAGKGFAVLNQPQRHQGHLRRIVIHVFRMIDFHTKQRLDRKSDKSHKRVASVSFHRRAFGITNS